jgi:VWFA-related protein
MVWRLTLTLTSVLALQTFSSRTLGVRVDVLVMEGGQPVAGLTARDFQLRDNGVLQRVDVIEAVDVPINVVLALDTSASVHGRKLTDLIAAGDAILDGLKPVDRGAVVTFNHAVTPAVELTADLSNVRATLRTIDPRGRTSVMDGVYVALTSTVDQAGRFLLVVCTDGSDTMSWLTPPEVLEASKRANAVVYAVTAGGGRRSEPLKDLADATGGQMLQVKRSEDFRSAFQRILTEFRTRYVLAYSPEGVSPGGFHRLDINVARRRAVVKAREGYIGIASSRHP